MNWEDAQKWEEQWHLTNPFIYWEQVKQEVYAEKMGLVRDYPDHNLKGIQVLDIGGGDCSMLLKYKNFKGHVSDPLMNEFPKWVRDRYRHHKIDTDNIKGEQLKQKGYDEVLIYNVLQHTQYPQKVIAKAKKAGKLIRIFEWIETPLTDGHIHTLHAKDLDKWLGGAGKVEQVNDRGCNGLCYYGVFV